MIKEQEHPEDYYDEKIKRNKEIIARVESGISLTIVGEEFGISKQRVSQIYQRGRSSRRGLIPLQEYCKLSGVNRDMAISNFKYGSLKGKKIGQRYFIEKDQIK